LEQAMSVDLVIVHSPVGGGHKAAALATAEAARARGLSVEVLDTFEHAPRLFGRTYVAAHLAGQAALPDLYGSAYFAADRRDGALEPVRRGWDHMAFAGLVKRVLELEPRAVVATHHLPLLVLGRARRLGKLAAPLVGVVTDYTAHAVWAERGVDALHPRRARARVARRPEAQDRHRRHPGARGVRADPRRAGAAGR
jgi:processive 1,2-diacylglycerol beta-glucosyltransferase